MRRINGNRNRNGNGVDERVLRPVVVAGDPSAGDGGRRVRSWSRSWVIFQKGTASAMGRLFAASTSEGVMMTRKDEFFCFSLF